MKRYIKSAILPVSNEDIDARMDIALNPNTPVDVLNELADDKDSDVRLCVVVNPSTPKDTIDKLLFVDKNIGFSELRFLEKVALCMETPPDILAKLSQYADDSVRFAVAKNPHTPIIALNALANDDNPAIRWTVADNVSTPADTLILLAGDMYNVSVRAAVAENLNTPIDTLKTLLNDPDGVVRSMAKRTYNRRLHNGSI